MPSAASFNFPFMNMDAAEQKEYLTSIRSLLYVAITRARQIVFITGYGEKVDYWIANDCYRQNPIIATVNMQSVF